MRFTSRTKVHFLVLYVVLVSFKTLACGPGTYASENLFGACVPCPQDCGREGSDAQSCKDACEKSSTTTLAVTNATAPTPPETPTSSERVVLTGHTAKASPAPTLKEIEFADEAFAGKPTTVLTQTVTIVITVIAGVLIVMVVLCLLLKRWRNSSGERAGIQPSEALTEIRVVSPEVSQASDDDALMGIGNGRPIPESGEKPRVLTQEETDQLISESLRVRQFSSNTNLPETSI